MAKTKAERRFEVLDGRLIDIQGSLRKLPELVKAINNLDRKVQAMSTNVDRIEQAAKNLTEDVGQVKTAIDGLKASQATLQGVVDDLKAQLAQGQLDQTRLDAAASTLETVDKDLDGITLPTPSPAPTEPPA